MWLCLKSGFLADCFVDAELLFCARNFPEEFKNFFFCWRLNADAAICADVYAVVTFSVFFLNKFLYLCLCYFAFPSLYIAGIICATFYILNVI